MSSAYGVTLDRLKGITVEGDVVQTGTYTVATVPAAASYTGAIIYVSNGAGGSPILAFSDGSNWKRSDTGATISS
jgi:hypothetical protein